jgi:hypothetical protein
MKTPPAVAALGAVVAGGAGVAGLLMIGAAFRRQPTLGGTSGPVRALHGSAALLALSVLVDSAVEHYRGSFENPGMFAPLIGSALAMNAGTSGATGHPTSARAFRWNAQSLSIAIGAAGAAFHLYNVFKKPGGFGWLNLFYGAPLGAPAALSVSGVVGLAADSVEFKPDGSARLWRLPAGRALAGLCAVALAGTVVEAALFHFRGAFQNPFMWAPVAAPPVAAGLLAKVALEAPARRHPLTRLWLSLTMILGFIGAGFHAYGVSRAMGGWRNWSQNFIDGPPLPAPPSFSALALAGLAALSLVERDARARDERVR